VLMPACSNRHVLVVDDDRINQELAAAILAALGFDPEVVGTGQAAISAAARGSYAAVLMDIRLPDMDGRQATREIRLGEAAGQHVPVIALTADATSGERQRCLAAGMDDYICKPISVDDVASVLARWVPNLNPEALGRVVNVGGPQLVLRLSEMFLVDAPASLRDMHEALARRDASRLAVIAHGLYGSAATLGLDDLAGYSERVERIATETPNSLVEVTELLDAMTRAFEHAKVVLDAAVLAETEQTEHTDRA
jgi:CheY-like chemotaxis protein/HPt (histidine-containing phosphotransfer) domain-containing protein